MRRLTEDQRAGVEHLARDKGITCKHCGSGDLRCGENARTYLGAFGFDLWCQNRASHPSDDPSRGTLQYFNLSSDEAHAIDIS